MEPEDLQFNVPDLRIFISMRRFFTPTLLLLFLLVAGCATPVGVRTLDSREADRKLAANVLTGEQLSSPTIHIINRLGLANTFADDRATAIASLHDKLLENGVLKQDLLFALTETSFLQAVESENPAYYLAAALYAYAFLFHGEAPQAKNAMSAFEPRLRTAVDLYNRSIAKGFTSQENPSQVRLAGGTYPLPFGHLQVDFDSRHLQWGNFRFVELVQAAEIDVRGLRNKYRWPGIGAPLVASTRYTKGIDAPGFAYVISGMKVPLTAFLRFTDLETGLRAGTLHSALEIYTTDKATSVRVEDREIPVEYELSSALASTLEGSQMYKLEIPGLLRGDINPLKKVARFKNGVFLTSPYKPGQIPLVLVHGTASSPARWAELINEVNNDRELWGRYQIWLFLYDTGNPVLYSAGILAEGLKSVVEELDPEGKDPALREMVIVGHSQGGLLTRMMATESGTAFWDNAFSESFETLAESPKVKELLQQSVVYSPLLFVKRLVFIATPHGGSYVAGGWIGRLATKLIHLPPRVVEFGKDIAMLPTTKGAALFALRDIPRSTDDMDPKSEFVRTLTTLPMATDVPFHSIIAVKNPEDPREKWHDGVVAYGSAHLEEAESELIIPSGHSVQSEPAAIEEIRRILVEHLRATTSTQWAVERSPERTAR
jgi:pimeloyl-ACP methyl ester carboxylesterase